MICYIICSGPRVGSHFLADLLKSTGVAGAPADHFNPLGAGVQGKASQVDGIRYGHRYVKELVTATKSSNGIFGTMIQFNQAANHVGLSRLNTIFPCAPKYIFLTRRDEVRQAVSLAIARQTGQFLANQEAVRPPVYNADQVRCCLEDVRNHNRAWETYFWEHKMIPFRVFYEDCVSDPVDTVNSVLQFVGGSELLIAADKPETSMQRQSDEVNEKWTSLYLQSPLHSRTVSSQENC